MSVGNKVIWSEGMFLRPQHFQQQDRYMERYVAGRLEGLGNYYWGISQLVIDKEPLKLGKVSITEISGIFPDGTPFSAPDYETLPPVLDIPDGLGEETIYLCIPLRRNGAVDTSINDDNGLARYRSKQFDARNSTSETADKTEIQIGQLRLALKLGSQDRSGYASIAITRIIEKTVDNPVKLDKSFIPPLINCKASAIFSAYFEELKGMFNQRGEALGHRLSDSGRAGSAEVADYMLLQLINRLEPLVSHLHSLDSLHPIDFYTELVQMTGELATFTTPSKRSPVLQTYHHDSLQQTFHQCFSHLRQQLSMVLEQSAISLNLAERKYGIYVAPITDPSLVKTASFVLAIKTALPTEAIRNTLPAQCKIAAVERIRELITTQLPGINIRPLPVAPRQVPYHAGFNYFELDRSNEHFKSLHNSGGVAVHLSGEYPELSIELWAIRD
ncbi:hypothetical protein SIN8267_00233 [Sinobacterium norvegicum]|uniref:Type VI secretion system baseplate subunit TssK n=1 Tax=Sinobacterium norvegicum TaxID=1641715 RepID=A0ABM9AA94_9GAMM|nr:type VI secretion system baseplate subunit TssK [Sinobacterium norvegicum]CAH0990148.1 hypothetical protein SIN8267_00233 [Sinobacterium norvegicum]